MISAIANALRIALKQLQNLRKEKMFFYSYTYFKFSSFLKIIKKIFPI